MQYRTLGRTGLKASILGMGTGGHNCLGQRHDPPVPEADIHRLLHGVFDLGINLYDTAPGYEDSELILGRALEDLPRGELIVSTKVTLADVSENGSPVTPATPAAIVQSVEASLERLQLDVVDLMLVSVGDASCYDAVFDDQIATLHELKHQGKIRFIGANEITRHDGAHEWFQRALPEDCFDVLMVGHNMINQSAQKSVFPVCLDKNIGTMNIFTVRNVFRNPARLTEVITELKQQGELPSDLDEQSPFVWLLEDPDIGSLVEAAYRYAAYTPGVSIVMCGTITLEKVAHNITSVEKGPLDPHHNARLKDTFGHITEAIGN